MAERSNRSIWIAITILWVIRTLGLVPFWVYLMIRDGFIETCYLQTFDAQVTGVISVVTQGVLMFLTRRARVDGERVLTAEVERKEGEKALWLRWLIVIPFFVGGIVLELQKPAATRVDLLLYFWIFLLLREVARVGARWVKRFHEAEQELSADTRDTAQRDRNEEAFEV